MQETGDNWGHDVFDAWLDMEEEVLFLFCWTAHCSLVDCLGVRNIAVIVFTDRSSSPQHFQICCSLNEKFATHAAGGGAALIFGFIIFNLTLHDDFALDSVRVQYRTVVGS